MTRPGTKKEKRISFSVDDAEHIYEWGYMYWLGSEMKFGREFAPCAKCQALGERLEAFIGKGAAGVIRALCRKNPGHREVRRHER